MREALIKIDHLFFSYEDLPILEDVSIEITSGEFVGIFGPNGGGKTTLLKLIMGLLLPTQGTVELLENGSSLERKKIGYVPQIARFDRDFPISSLEVVMMGCLSRLNRWGWYPKDVREKSLAVLERLGLLHKASSSFGMLSGGEAQRVLIGRAIVGEPKLLLLDEPTASVDAKAEEEIYSLLKELNQTMTILMVSHDLQTVVDKVGRLLCVQRKVSSLHAKELCEHFALGLYHTPLPSTRHFSL